MIITCILIDCRKPRRGDVHLASADDLSPRAPLHASSGLRVPTSPPWHGCYPLAIPLRMRVACLQCIPDIPPQAPNRKPQSPRIQTPAVAEVRFAVCRCTSSMRCKNGILALQTDHAGCCSQMQASLAAHHGCYASDLTYDIVLRQVSWIFEIYTTTC